MLFPFRPVAYRDGVSELLRSVLAGLIMALLRSAVKTLFGSFYDLHKNCCVLLCKFELLRSVCGCGILALITE